MCEKPAGLATQTANVRETDLVSEIRQYLNNGYVGVIHRLDRPVAGLLVFAKTPSAAASLSKQVQTEDMGKTYLAFAEGRIRQTDDPVLLENFLLHDRKRSVAVVVPDKEAANRKDCKRARLTYRVLSYDDTEDVTKLEIRLQTGRFHQIRAQLSHIGHPVLGDVKYGAKKPAASEETAGIALYAYQLRFMHPVTGKEMFFQMSNSLL